VQQTEDVQYAEYTEWKPEDYLTDYYSEVMPDERFALEALVDWVRMLGPEPIPVALEFGCGPTVHHLFPVAPYIRDIHMAEYLESNRGEVERWLRGQAGAHNWSAFTSLTLQLEGNASPTEGQIAAREQELRSRVSRVLPGDARDPNPMGADKRGYYPLVMSHYCAEGVTTDINIWRECMTNILSMVAPGGTVMLSACGSASYYCVGDRYFPCAGVSPQDVLNSLRENGFGELDLRTRLVPGHSDQGYSSVIFARGVRRG
jgi:hypothetical protein